MIKLINIVACFTLLALCDAHAEHFNELVNSEDTKLYLEINAKEKKPVLLFLHGGPGDVELGLLPFQDKVGQLLEPYFTVAYLHQRGAGKSPPVKAADMTTALHINDVHNVVNLLKKKYRQQKVTLVGHSWGGALAALYTVKYPDAVENLVFIATFQNALEQMRSSYEATLAWANATNNRDALEELTQYSANKKQGNNDWFTLAKWASQANGGIIQNFNFPEFVMQHKLNEDYPNWQQRRQQLAMTMKQEFEQINVHDAVSKLTIPALFIAGKQDSITTEKMMRQNYQAYTGKKAFVTLEKSHHLPFIDQPKQLAEVMIDFLKQ